MYITKMGSNVKFTVFALLTITLYGGLFFAVWNLHSQVSELRGFVGANPNPHSSDEATVMDTLKRLTRQSGSSQSAALAELIEKKLYTIMNCAKDDADNLTECSLKPGPKGDKGNDGPQGMNGEPGVKGHIGYPGHKGEVGPKGPIGDPGPMGPRGDKGDMGEIGQRGEAGIKGERGLKGHYGFPGHKGESGGPGAIGVKGDRGFGGNNGRKGEKGMTGVPGPPGPLPTIPSERCGGFGWRKVTHLDMTDTSQNCPQGLTLTGYSNRSCGRTHTNDRACSSVTFPVGGGQYSRVCGRAKAYHWGELYSFLGYNQYSRGINAQYVDGLSFTHGTPRTHIWTFAAGLHQANSSDTFYRAGFEYFHCPCNPGNPFGSPPFVGNDYFCESGVSSRSFCTWISPSH